jgi:hypothetical protein
MVREVACDDLLQPFPLFGDRLVHSPTQSFFDFLEFRRHAVAAGFPMNQKVSPT